MLIIGNCERRFGRGRERGVGLVELLVAILILGVGVLGYAAMQLFALQSAEESGYRTHATLIARDALERSQIDVHEDSLSIFFRASSWPSSTVYGGDYPAVCRETWCDRSQMAAADIAQLSWIAGNSLPGGMIRAADNCGGGASPRCVVVTWKEMTPSECLQNYPSIPAGSSDYHCVVLEGLRP